ncbi:hypothetical protein ACTS95_14800 [Empedobacter brevis]
MNTFYKILAIIFISFIISYLSLITLETKALLKYLNDNLLTIIITLLAINTATSGFIVGKICDILQQNDIDFKRVIKQMKFSLLEQLISIGLAIVIVILNSSNKIVFENKELLFCTLLCSLFINTLDVLRDTGVSVFDILEINNELKKNKKS